LRAQIYEEFRQFVWNCLHKKASHCAVFAFLCSNGGSIRLDEKILAQHGGLLCPPTWRE
jgi:hypothetical protein